MKQYLFVSQKQSLGCYNLTLCIAWAINPALPEPSFPVIGMPLVMEDICKLGSLASQKMSSSCILLRFPVSNKHCKDYKVNKEDNWVMLARDITLYNEVLKLEPVESLEKKISLRTLNITQKKHLHGYTNWTRIVCRRNSVNGRSKR